MKIVFRVRYRTVFGQSLWLLLRRGSGQREFLPMRWLNEEQWELRLEAGPREKLSYRYQLREEGNGLQLDEWGAEREVVVPQADCLWLADSWRSAGALDCAYEAKGLRSLLPARGPFRKMADPPGGTHRFAIRVAGVPADRALCLIGEAPELGSWDATRARRLQEWAPNQWALDVDLPADCNHQYKYGFCDPATGILTEYECGANRVLEAHSEARSQFTLVQDEALRRDPMAGFRGAGVAIPVFSLRSDKGLGVGEFADLVPLGEWARDLGMQLIQILPIHDTNAAGDWTDSYPYSAISCFALHPLYLRLDQLDLAMDQQWHEELAAERERLNALEVLDYEAVMQAKLRLTRAVFERHREAILADPGFRSMREAPEGWMLPYAAFCVLRDQHGSGDVTRWGSDAVFRRERVAEMWQASSPQRGDMEYWLWLQHELDRQLRAVVAQLHGMGVLLKGDLPIGIDRCSVEAWSAPELFHLGSQSGAPPDFFSEQGQNWGFPTYHWERMREDGYAWWRSRLAHLQRYFDVFRIDHILGFFRIWQIPAQQVEGLMGWFEPAQPVRPEELRERSIDFDRERYCRPWLARDHLLERFGKRCQEVIDGFLQPRRDGHFEFREAFDSQRKLVDHFRAQGLEDRSLLRELMACHGEVLLFEEPGSDGTRLHPRYCLQRTRSFADLEPIQQERLDALYNDYFFKRQDFWWRAGGLEKLSALKGASEMLLCGEDLGMVPECVPGVMRELGILSLEIQRMPKTYGAEFDDPLQAPYLSVVSPSTHDTSGLRGWWRECPSTARRMAWAHLGLADPPPELDAQTATRLLERVFQSPAMWAVVPLQDLLAIDEDLRHPDPDAERINDPSINPHNWRYRMHLTLAELAAAKPLARRIAGLLAAAGRAGTGDA